MRNLKYFLGLFMIFIFACSQHEESITSVNSQSFETTLIKNNIDISKYRNPISLKGNIKVWVTKNHELVAYAETDDFIHLFILQYLENDLSPQENFNTIVFLDHSFSLLSDSGENLLCEVKDKEESISAGNDLKKINGNSNFGTVTGAGVAHIWLNKNEIDDLNIDNKFEQFRLRNSIYDSFEKDSATLSGEKCSSGGEGSSSCSVTGCSVSCSSGYYACCNPGGTFTGPSCKCISNVPILE